jgi:hypothetical protein
MSRTGKDVTEGIQRAGGNTARYFNSSLRQKKQSQIQPQKKEGSEVKFKKLAYMTGAPTVLGRFAIPGIDYQEGEPPVGEPPVDVDGGDETVNKLVTDIDIKKQKPAINVRSILGIPEDDDD